MLSRGGLSWFGGLILGTTAGLVYLRYKKVNVYKVADLFVFMPRVVIKETGIYAVASTEKQQPRCLQ